MIIISPLVTTHRLDVLWESSGVDARDSDGAAGPALCCVTGACKDEITFIERFLGAGAVDRRDHLECR